MTVATGSVSAMTIPPQATRIGALRNDFRRVLEQY